MDNVKAAKLVRTLPGEMPKEAFKRTIGRKAIGQTPAWAVEDIPQQEGVDVILVFFGEKLYVYG